ncbi:MAG: hypothetical protein OEY55_07830 [Acidimicrobiia bacterium]|nr:hypothetical protein [Acidimicrobiia bacterium]MDH5421697.1 hypothetical protein [Acidimicrobiia bacterium]
MSDIPEHLLRRSAEAKAKALGIPVEQVLAEMTGEAPVTAMDAGDQPKVETVEAVPQTPAETSMPVAQDAPQTDAAVEVAAEEQAEATAAGPADGAGGEIDYEAAAAKAGMPASLLQRSVEAKAKASGASAAQVLAEMLGEEAPSAPPATAPAPESAPAASTPEPEPTADAVSADVIDMPPAAAAPAPATSAPAASAQPPATGGATAVAARPIAQPEAVPEGVRTQRLLTVVKANAIQQVKAEPTDKVSTWPHLMIMEFAVLLGVTALLIVLSVILQAPLLESANFNATPNPSKAPWYFLGLQELLSYFDPQIAGVTVPTIIGLVGFMAIPYVDKNPSNKPSDRKFAIFMYTFFMMGSATLTILGVLFRGPGFNFTYPWVDGIFFDDLKDWVNFE